MGSASGNRYVSCMQHLPFEYPIGLVLPLREALSCMQSRIGPGKRRMSGGSHVTGADSTVDAVRALILDGIYRPGARLGEVELAAAVGVSRTPIREALRQLAAEGLVEIRPNKGARVVSWTNAELDDVFDLRAQVEGLGARLAAQRASDEWAAKLQAIAVRHLEATTAEPRDLEVVYAINSEFHNGLVAAVGGSSFPSVLGSLVHTPILFRTLHMFDDAAMLRSAHHHLEIVAAIRARDPDWAESVMRSHLLSARASLLGPRVDLRFSGRTSMSGVDGRRA